MSLTLVVAATKQNGIGKSGVMPWHIPKDLAYFRRVTTDAPAARVNAVFMGRKTWESIPAKFRPLKKRINVVLSRNNDYDLSPGSAVTPSLVDSPHRYHDLKTAVETFRSHNDVHRLFITGGTSLYHDVLAPQTNCRSLQADRILMTRIHNPEFDCDVFFPDVLGGGGWRRASQEELNAWVGFEVPAGIQTENGIEFEFQMWVNIWSKREENP